MWLKIAREGVGVRTLTTREAVDIGLCYGWISDQSKALDQVFFVQKYVPREVAQPLVAINVATTSRS